ncbi:MAG TPA: peptidoglycan-binding domain-containing protein [Candidatus Sulfotelmatobacter sp.]|nr:peptidoglycan-binding domain-containing protein [Candidatus Sulfotelmatobacter sp.]
MRRFLLITASALAVASGGACFAQGSTDTAQAATGPTANAVRFAQEALQDRGYYDGRITGVVGPRTRRAIERFQQRNHLPVTAALDRTTLDGLGAGAIVSRGELSGPSYGSSGSATPDTGSGAD